MPDHLPESWALPPEDCVLQVSLRELALTPNCEYCRAMRSLPLSVRSSPHTAVCEHLFEIEKHCFLIRLEDP